MLAISRAHSRLCYLHFLFDIGGVGKIRRRRRRKLTRRRATNCLTRVFPRGGMRAALSSHSLLPLVLEFSVRWRDDLARPSSGSPPSPLSRRCETTPETGGVAATAGAFVPKSRTHAHTQTYPVTLVPSLITRICTLKTALFEAARRVSASHTHAHTAHTHTLHTHSPVYLQQPFVQFDMVQATISLVGTFAKARV